MSDRRSFLRGLVSIPLIGGNASAAFAAPTGMGDLWHRHQLARGAETIAWARVSAANERLPWWAKPGPIYVDHLGAMVGPEVGWPAVEDYSLPRHEGAFRMVRMSPGEIAKHYDLRLQLVGRSKAEELRDRDQAQLDDRLARRKAEMVVLGIPDLDRIHEAAFTVRADLSDAIESLPDGSADVTAAKILVYLAREAGSDDSGETSTIVDLSSIALRGLLPHLDGELALDAADAVADPERPVRDMRFARGFT